MAILQHLIVFQLFLTAYAQVTEAKAASIQKRSDGLIPWELRNENQGGYLDVLNLERPKYLENYKNPCWKESSEGGAIRCLPYFFLSGITKCGTTDLWYRIGQHPNISSEYHRKESGHWWTMNRFLDPARYSIDAYTEYFQKTTNNIVENSTLQNGKEYHPLVTGDGSPDTFWKNAFWKRIPQNFPFESEPRFVNAHLIKHMIPDAKILVSMRNPVSHIFSVFEFFEKQNKTPENFHAFVLEELAAWNDCIQNNTVRHCVYNISYPMNFLMRFPMTIYAVYVKDWLEVFPREQIHIIQLEEYAENQTEVMTGIFKFLDVGPLPDVEKISEVPVVNYRRNEYKMKKETQKLLEDFYRPYQNALSELLGEDRWRYF